MKSINTTTIRAEQFTYRKNFIFTIFETEKSFELWVSYKDYGVSELCFGIDKADYPSVKTISAFVKLLEDNPCLMAYANNYKDIYMND